MYYKIINNRTVFDQCKTIQVPGGEWISNPSEEQIIAAGWSVYVPPEVIPEPQTEPNYDDVVVAIKKILSTTINELSDEDALEVAVLYPTGASKIGEELTVGERLWYDGKLYKVIQAHTSQDNGTPDVTPALYAEVSIEEFPEWKQPMGSEDSYMMGDKVSYSGKHGISTTDNNVGAPGVYGGDEIN